MSIRLIVLAVALPFLMGSGDLPTSTPMASSRMRNSSLRRREQIRTKAGAPAVSVQHAEE
jgi:hypothetical protein